MNNIIFSFIDYINNAAQRRLRPSQLFSITVQLTKATKQHIFDQFDLLADQLIVAKEKTFINLKFIIIYFLGRLINLFFAKKCIVYNANNVDHHDDDYGNKTSSKRGNDVDAPSLNPHYKSDNTHAIHV